MAVPFVHQLYPRAHQGRLSHPSIKVDRPKFFKAAAINFLLLQLLFFALFCYLFGALYLQVPRTHHLSILWVDFDGGVIGDAVRDAYQALQADNFPSLVERPATAFPSISSLREAVCRNNYWAALYVAPGSSELLRLAIAGSNASAYNPSTVLSYIWDEARYPTVVDGAIANNIQVLSERARLAFVARNGTSALATIPPNNAAAVTAFASPWILTATNIKQTIQGPRAIYNTLVIVLVLIQDFFFLGVVNGLYVQFKIYTRISPWRIILVRDGISAAFTMIGSLLITTSIWAFKAGWDLSGKQFGLTWLALWLFAHVNFLTLDVFTIWVPPQFVSMSLITWVVLNVTSILTPFDLSSPFYRWSYAMPAHAVYEVLTDIWSGGCNPHLYYALPVLFAYELSGLLWTSLGVYKRSHFAVITEETAEKAMRMRVEAAVKLERQHDAALSQTVVADPDASKESARPTEDIERAQEAVDREQAQKEIDEVGAEIERMETRVSRLGNFGPSFTLVGSRQE